MENQGTTWWINMSHGGFIETGFTKLVAVVGGRPGGHGFQEIHCAPLERGQVLTYQTGVLQL